MCRKPPCGPDAGRASPYDDDVERVVHEAQVLSTAAASKDRAAWWPQSEDLMVARMASATDHTGTRKWSGSKAELDHPRREGDVGFYAWPAVSRPSELDPTWSYRRFSHLL